MHKDISIYHSMIYTQGLIHYYMLKNLYSLIGLLHITLWHRNVFHIIGSLRGEATDHRFFPALFKNSRIASGPNRHNFHVTSL